ncbi:hypothetical protein Hamer_G029686, partial [Homarus americanus]
FRGKPGHKAYFCWTRPQPNKESFGKDHPDVGGTFRPFLSQGTVEVDGVETPPYVSSLLVAKEWTSYSVTICCNSLQMICPAFSLVCCDSFFVNDHNVTPDVDNSLSLKGRFANPIVSQDISSAVALIAAQEQQVSLRLFFDLMSDSANDSGPTTTYLSQDCVLCCR